MIVSEVFHYTTSRWEKSRNEMYQRADFAGSYLYNR